jgi:hypothetical protein
MLKILSIFGFIFITCGLMQGCNPVISQNAKLAIVSETPKQQKETSLSKNVEFKGVSFAYNQQILGEAAFEEVAELALANKDDKPDMVAPKHVVFKLKKPEQKREITIKIYPIEDFKRMFAVSKLGTKQIKEAFANLGKVLKDEKFHVKNQIPFIPFYDAEQAFVGKVKLFPFQNGTGIFFLTQFNIEPSLINNEGLSYIFQGITGDGKNYVLAEFPASVSFLPSDFDANEYEDYKISERFTADKSNEKKYNEYVSKISARLEKTSPNEFEPNLNLFEELISSLKIKN